MHSSSLNDSSIPRFGVKTDQEELLAQVGGASAGAGLEREGQSSGGGGSEGLGQIEMRIPVYLPFETLRKGGVKEPVCAVCLSMGFSRQEY